MFKTPLAATVIALAALIAAPAAAAAEKGAWQVGNASIHLYNSDLNMNSATGRAELLARVERAAARLCRDRADARDCEQLTVAETLRAPAAAPLRIAMAEREAVRVAAR